MITYFNIYNNTKLCTMCSSLLHNALRVNPLSNKFPVVDETKCTKVIIGTKPQTMRMHLRQCSRSFNKETKKPTFTCPNPQFSFFFTVYKKVTRFLVGRQIFHKTHPSSTHILTCARSLFHFPYCQRAQEGKKVTWFLARRQICHMNHLGRQQHTHFDLLQKEERFRHEIVYIHNITKLVLVQNDQVQPQLYCRLDEQMV